MLPEIVGRYELLRPLGAGGMGEVFLGRDRTLDRQVAVKRVRAGDAQAARYILHEARVIASLDHPNIATVYDIVEHGGEPHIIMEYVEGATLSSRLAAGPLGEAQAIDYGRQIADALAYAHQRHVLHCDIKPGNVMITPNGVPKVLDFGIARRDSQTSAGATTTTHAIQGTPPYMAPEVLLGSPPSQQSDVFSLGVMLYELVAGKRPYEGRGAAAVLTAMTMPPPALDAAAAGVSAALSTIVARAIHTDRQQRLQSAHELKAALDRLASGATMTLAPAPVRRGWSPKAMAWTAALAMVCAALVAGVPRLARMATPQSVLGVMMFNNTGDARNDYLAAGLADVLAGHLADAPGMTVVPRTAMATLTADTQVPEAVASLGLTHVLTGSIQRAGDHLRVSLSVLGDAGRKVEWSRSFDGTIDDVLHLQRRAARESLTALQQTGLVSAATVNQARQQSPTGDPDAFDAYSHGRVLFERSDVPGNLDRAIELFTRAATLDPGFVRAHAALGEAYWGQYRRTRDPAWIDRARGATLEALRRDADDPTILYSLAVIDHGTGRIDQAIEGLNQLLSIQPASDEAHRLLGRIYSEQSRFDRAIEEFREANRIRPNYPLTLRTLALAYLDAGAISDAIATLLQLTALQPDNGAAFQLLGAAYLTGGDLDLALVAYQRANAIAPRPTVFSNIGVIHHTRREYDKAVEAYRQAIALQGKEAATRRNLADALWMTGDRQGAVAEYEAAVALASDALRVNPANARTHALAAFCEAKLGRHAAARRRMATALSLAPNDNDVVYKHAVVQLLAGQREQALQTLGRALELGYNRSRLGGDRDLDPLRDHPEFERLTR
jgi:eukaryotic-like serine/threonine-protein kinase